jgi:hypothetical protein
MLYHNDITRIDFGTTLLHFAHHAKRMMLIVKSMQVLQFFTPGVNCLHMIGRASSSQNVPTAQAPG